MGTDWTWKACSRPGLTSTSTETTWKRPSYDAATDATTWTKSAEAGVRCDHRTTTAGTFWVPVTMAWKPPSVPSITSPSPVSYTHLRAHETVLDLVCRLLL